MTSRHSDEGRADPLLEEIKVDVPRPATPKARSVAASFHASDLLKGYAESLNDGQTPDGNDDQPQSVSRIHYISNELIAMGFDQTAVFALMKNFQVADVQSAIDMLSKAEHGWEHTFIPQEGKETCEICQEPFREHLEGKLEEQDRAVLAPTSEMGEESPRLLDIENDRFVRRQSDHVVARDEVEDMLQNIYNDVEKAEEEKELAKTYTCNICMRDIRESSGFALPCGHIHCKECVRSYLNDAIDSGAVLEIRCPQVDCNRLFTREQISKICTKPVYEKYLRFRENIEVNMSKDMKWCPAPDCGRYIKGSNAKPHVVCECGFHMCFRCGEAWHPGVSCRKNFENLYSKWASDRKIQRCPKCKIRIEKNAGCNHMNCTFCHYEWCWICGRHYSYSHFDSDFFGCATMQYTSTDWGMGRIAIYMLVMLLLWPVISLALAYKVTCQYFTECVDNERCGCGCIACVLGLLAVGVGSILVWAVLLLPSFIYRLYVMLYVLVRISRI